MVKPFEPLELVARIKMIMRRTANIKPTVRKFGDLFIDLDSRIVRVGERVIVLSPKEFNLLEILSGSPGRSFSREVLMEQVWGYGIYTSTRTVDTHILTLRQKIGANRIRTVFKIGYAFEGCVV